jgi:hypothetical protein
MLARQTEERRAEAGRNGSAVTGVVRAAGEHLARRYKLRIIIPHRGR